MIGLITSRENPMIREFGKLSVSKSYRMKTGRFVFEGARLCADALRSGAAVESAFLTKDALLRHAELLEALEASGARVFEISTPVAEKIRDTQSPQGVFCVARMLDKALGMDKIDICGTYLALENLQDPGNLGTILRTAEAFGLDGAVLSQDCVDLYSPKVVRASMGAVFRLPFAVAGDLPAELKALGGRGMKTFAAVADKGAGSVLSADFSGGAVVAVGNEGAGLTPACVAACTAAVTIPMPGRAESLNASTAAAVLMWEMIKAKREKPGRS